jgi:thiamine kinase-like enzyme
MTLGIVRVGDTVRRPVKPSSEYASQLLIALGRCGFTAAPRHLGFDEAGREVLSYLPGWVPAKLQRFTDRQVAEAGKLLRAYHDATRRTGLAGRHPVVCHHDAGPNNFVFDACRPYALIDFDMAAPGDPLDDVGYMAWLWCVSSKASAPPVEIQAAQIRVLADAYGLQGTERADIVDAMLMRQSRNVVFWRDLLGDTSFEAATSKEIVARIQWSLRERAYTETHRATLIHGLLPSSRRFVRAA